MTRDLTQGSPIRLILSFALPTLLGLLFQQFYSLVDTMIVGKFLGPNPLAALGATGAIHFMVLGFCIGMANGFGIPVAHRVGAKEMSSMRVHVWNAIYLSIGLSIVLALITGLLSRHILLWMDTPEDILDEAHRYISVIFYGIPVVFLYNLPAAIIRSLGDSKTPVYFLAIASVLNIVLDIALIGGLNFGVEGAAIATVISQGVAGGICVIYMWKKYPQLQSTPQERKLNQRACYTLCAMGLPMGLQYSITAIGSVLLQTAVNGLGTLYVAGITLGQKVALFFYCPYDALGGTIATYCGQNVGAGRLDRLKKGLGAATLLGFACALITLVILALFSEELCLLFLDDSQTEVIALGTEFLYINSLFMCTLVIVNVFRFAIQGMGFGQFAIFAGVMELIARGIFGLYVVPTYGFLAACLAGPAAWILADCFLIPGALYCISKLKKQASLSNTQEHIIGESGDETEKSSHSDPL